MQCRRQLFATVPQEQPGSRSSGSIPEMAHRRASSPVALRRPHLPFKSDGETVEYQIFTKNLEMPLEKNKVLQSSFGCEPLNIHLQTTECQRVHQLSVMVPQEQHSPTRSPAPSLLSDMTRRRASSPVALRLPHQPFTSDVETVEYGKFCRDLETALQKNMVRGVTSGNVIRKEFYNGQIFPTRPRPPVRTQVLRKLKDIPLGAFERKVKGAMEQLRLRLDAKFTNGLAVY